MHAGRLARVPVLLALAALTLAAGGCASGGSASGGSASAQALLGETFESNTPIESGHIDLALTLTSNASSATTAHAKLLGVALSGPFQGEGAGHLPQFSLQLALGAGAHTLQAGATATASDLYIELAGSWFVAPPGTLQQLQQSYAATTRASSSAKSRATFAGLGIEPGDWIADPTIVPSPASSETTHISGHLDVARFLADAQKLSGASGALGLGAASAAGSELPSSGGLAALAGALRSARVDIYTGTSDHQLQRLTLSAQVAATPQARSALGVSSAATLTLDLRFAELNKPQTISAPANPKPISELVPALQRLGSALGAAGA